MANDKPESTEKPQDKPAPPTDKPVIVVDLSPNEIFTESKKPGKDDKKING